MRLSIRGVAASLAVVGTGISAYLSYEHARGASVVCLAGGKGCETVANSPYAEMFGVRVSTLGILGYVALIIAALIPGFFARMAGVAMSLVAVIFSLYLTYLELYVIHAICQWCVASAIVVTTLAVVQIVWLRREFAGELEVFEEIELEHMEEEDSPP